MSVYEQRTSLLTVFFSMDLGVPSGLKRAIAVLGMVSMTLARALAVCSVPPAGRESDLYRRRPRPRPLLTPPSNERVEASSRDQVPGQDDVISDDLNMGQQACKHQHLKRCTRPHTGLTEND